MLREHIFRIALAKSVHMLGVQRLYNIKIFFVDLHSVLCKLAVK